MQKIIFFLIVAIFLLGGGYFFMRKNNADLSFLQSNEISPVEKWKDILIGKWKFKTVMNEKSGTDIYEGEVEYYSNNQFLRYVTYNAYDIGDTKRETPFFTAGGSLKGVWSVDSTGFWTEKEVICNIYNTVYSDESKTYDVCKNKFRNASYGNILTNYSKDNIKNFNKNTIIIETIDFSNGGKGKYEFTKIE